MSLKIVARSNWTAVPPKYKPKPLHPATDVFYMCTFTDRCYTGLDCTKFLQNTQNHHMVSRNLSDIRYNFMIGDDGVVYEGRGWFTRPDLPSKFADYSTKSILIAFIGRYFTENNITPIMLRAAGDLIDYAVQNNYLSKDYQRKIMLNYFNNDDEDEDDVDV